MVIAGCDFISLHISSPLFLGHLLLGMRLFEYKPSLLKMNIVILYNALSVIVGYHFLLMEVRTMY